MMKSANRTRRLCRLALVTTLALMLGGCGAKVAPQAESAELTFDQPAAGQSAALTPKDAAARANAGDGAVRLFAVSVGKGDALILRVGDYACLIDTGKAKAMGKIAAALECMAVDHLNAVFITHTDDDHTGGLEWLACGDIPVDGWYASAMFTGVKADKHAAAKAAAQRGQEIRWLRRGDAVPLGDTGAVLRVLAPASLYRDKDDNNSLVMLLESGQGRILLTGDMELPEEAELLSQGDDLSCAVLKVPNHADDDTVSEAFARAAGAQIALISTDGFEKPGTPDPGVVSRLRAAGSQVAVTEDAGLGLLVTLSNGVAGAERVDIDGPEVSGLTIADVDASDDRITLRNGGDAAIALGGFYLHSDRGDELYAFPEGTSIGPGQNLAVGTRSTDGDYDLLWDDKKVIHKSKADAITLYDGFGRYVDSMENGK